MTYFGNVNSDLLRLIPLKARQVLELGCGEGALAAAYRSRNPKAHYTAVEIHEPSARMAVEHVDRLLVTDFESLDDQDLTPCGQYDAIILGDVLEHMKDPARALVRLHGMLSDGGSLVLCVPNVAHWTALFYLMHGLWPSEDAGLFDRTHLHFFTLRSLGEALTRAGFQLLKCAPRQFLLDQDRAKQWIPPLADLAERMGINREEFIQRSSTLQYVLVARKSAGEPVNQLNLYMASFASKLMDVRTRLPAEYLESSPRLLITHQTAKHLVPEVASSGGRIMIAQRPMPNSEDDWINVIDQSMRRGWMVVLELDDHPDLISRVNNKSMDILWKTVAASHAVQTSTEALANVLRAHNPEVAVFPNAAFTLAPRPVRNSSPARVFFGAAHRERLSGPIALSLGRLLEQHPDVVFEVVHDRAFFDALPTNAKVFHPTLPYEEYLAVMSKCDIALLPLEGSEPERFKSDLKFIEAGSRGLAVVASPCVYGTTMRDGVTGLIAEEVADWAPALECLFNDPSLRNSLAQAAWEEVRDHRMFAYQIKAHEDWYASLWARRAELEADLISRVPRLGREVAR